MSEKSREDASDASRSARPGSDRHRHSGSGPASEPRRPGTGARQARGVSAPDDKSTTHLALIPGQIVYGDGPVTINAGAEVVTLEVTNTADRPIQVGSHYHFAEVNPGLEFDRDKAWGRRLNVLSGGSVRFEPGVTEAVELIPIAGQRIVAGLRGAVGGKLDG